MQITKGLLRSSGLTDSVLHPTLTYNADRTQAIRMYEFYSPTVIKRMESIKNRLDCIQ